MSIRRTKVADLVGAPLRHQARPPAASCWDISLLWQVNRALQPEVRMWWRSTGRPPRARQR